MAAPSLLFIHRSVGRNLVIDGNLYGLTEDAGRAYILHDFGQNTDILHDEKGRHYAVAWHFPGDDTKPANYAELFSKQRLAERDITLESILAYDIIAIKSCYTANHLSTDGELEASKQAYRQIINFFADQPDKKLVILTSPPLTPLRTQRSDTERARVLATWLASGDFGPNVFVFDLFDKLAEPSGERQANTLRRAYRRWLPFDSHPNARASQEVAPLLVRFLSRVATS